jgi:isopentenyl-diphosphate Delta-isomerase
VNGAGADEVSVVRVGDDGQPAGVLGRGSAHAGAGQRHLAFAALLLDGQGRLLLARRAASKALWPGVWDLGVASHPLPGERVPSAAERRVREEFGTSARLAAFGPFDYWAEDPGRGSEREYCWALAGRLDGVPRPDPVEVSEWRALEVEELLAGLDQRAPELCPWAPLTLLAVGEALAARGGIEAGVNGALSPLAAPGARTRIREALGSWPGLRSWALP